MKRLLVVNLVFQMAGGMMEASQPKQLVEFVTGDQPRIEVFAGEKRDTPVSRLLYGKFTEHLGRNVYGGAWGQILRNTGFEPAKYFTRSEDDLPGRIAHMGFDKICPDLLAAYKEGVGFMWARHGAGQLAYCLDSDRKAGETAQRIDARSLETPEAGICQPIYLPLHRTDAYELSLWAKGTVADFRVSIETAEGRLLDSASVTGIDGEWRKYTVELKPNRIGIARGRPLMFTIGLTAPGTLWLDQCFLFPADNLGGFDPDVVRLYKNSMLPILRFPGGNFASGYHWKDGIGPVDQRPIRLNPAWSWDEPNHVGTDEWMKFCELVGCEALICVNAGDGTPEEAAQWVEYCNGGPNTEYGKLRAQNGHPEPYGVKYWEIGNELFGNWQIGHCTPEEYAERYRRFYDAMRKIDPNILFIANGQDPAWNKPIIERDADILRSMSTHCLVGSTISEDTDKELVFTAYMGLPFWQEGHFRHMIQGMLEGGVKDPRQALTELQVFTHRWGLPSNRTMTEALMYSGMLNAAIRLDGLVEMITHSALINHGGGMGKDREYVYADPVHWANHMYATQSGRWPVKLRLTCQHFSVPAVGDIPACADAPWLDAVALLDDSGKQLSLVVANRHPKNAMSVPIGLESFRAQPEVVVETLAGNYMAHNTWQKPTQVRIRRSKIKADDSGLEYRFPASSLTLLKLNRAD